MTPHSVESTDGLGGEKIIYSHFSLKPQKFPLPYQLYYKTDLQLQQACQVLGSLAYCQASGHMMDAKLL